MEAPSLAEMCFGKNAIKAVLNLIDMQVVDQYTQKW